MQTAPVDQVTSLRLQNQGLSGTGFRSLTLALRALGAVQAQDFFGAKWALGQRVPGASDADVEAAFQDGKLLRTHVLRPTWHFVAPDDARWMLELSAPGIRRKMAYYDRRYGLDEASFRVSNRTVSRALAKGEFLTRDELAAALGKAGIRASGPALGHLMLRAELDCVVCSGPRRGKQFTYALFDARAGTSPSKTRDEALAELARRFFASHGPAFDEDLSWWSGLTLRDARRGIEAAGLRSRELDKVLYFKATRARRAPIPLVRLLPNYDEYLIGFKDRRFFFDAARFGALGRGDNVFSNHLIVVRGRVAGGWRRTTTTTTVTVDARVLVKLGAAERRALDEEARRYARFLGLELALRVATG
jgi:hypothetical protein